jgi:tetratricopeptide (TPR) repeat protein
VSAAYRQNARSGLVRVDLALGDTSSAKSSYSAALSDPSKFSYNELIQAGVAASQVNDDSAAMQLFRSAVAANPYHRDGLSNLVIYEIRAKDYDGALTLLDRLKTVDPDGDHGRLFVLAYAGVAKKYADLNKDIVAPYQKAKAASVKKVLTDSAALTTDSNRVYTERAVEANSKADSMPVVVSFTEFSDVNDKATLAGTIANHTATEKTYTMKVDFLDKSGNVIASQTQTVGPVAPQTAGKFSISATAPGIAAFKYAPLDN